MNLHLIYTENSKSTQIYIYIYICHGYIDECTQVKQRERHNYFWWRDIVGGGKVEQESHVFKSGSHVGWWCCGWWRILWEGCGVGRALHGLCLSWLFRVISIYLEGLKLKAAGLKCPAWWKLWVAHGRPQYWFMGPLDVTTVYLYTCIYVFDKKYLWWRDDSENNHITHLDRVCANCNILTWIHIRTRDSLSDVLSVVLWMLITSISSRFLVSHSLNRRWWPSSNATYTHTQT